MTMRADHPIMPYLPRDLGQRMKRVTESCEEMHAAMDEARREEAAMIGPSIRVSSTRADNRVNVGLIERTFNQSLPGYLETGIRDRRSSF